MRPHLAILGRAMAWVPAALGLLLGAASARALDGHAAAVAPQRLAQASTQQTRKPETYPPRPDTRLPTPPRLPPIKPPGGGREVVACSGGRVVRGICLCPSGTALRGGACRKIARLPPKRDRETQDVPPPGKPDRKPPSSASPGEDIRPPRTVRPPSNPVLPPAGGATRAAPDPPSVPQGPALSAADTEVPGEIVATLAPGAPAGVEDEVARDFGLRVLERLDLTLTGERVVRFAIADQRSIGAVLSALAAETRLREPQPNFVYLPQQSDRPQSAPADLQYALSKLEAPTAHRIAKGKGTLIAVIDSGVDGKHPDLSGALSREIDVTRSGNGGTAPFDAHGTAIAGVIAARGLVKGVAPEAAILSIRAFQPGVSGGPATSTSVVLAAGLDAAVGEGARIVNLSLAGPSDPLVKRLVAAAASRGVMLVAAAGNKGPQAPTAYPAGYEEVIAVTATDAADLPYAKANRGAYIALAAPGVDVLTVGAAKSHQLQSGTSFAAAHVSGVLALMLELSPGLSPDEARSALVASAGDLGVSGPDPLFGAGLVNALRAVGVVQSKRAQAR